MSDECNDLNPDHCGICFELYGRGTSFALNNRCASSTCRHAMCFGCAIQHAVNYERTTCPFCRAPDAYGLATFDNGNSELIRAQLTLAAATCPMYKLVYTMVGDTQLTMVGVHSCHEIVILSTERSSGSFSWTSFTLNTSVVSNDENAVATAAVIDSAVATEPSS